MNLTKNAKDLNESYQTLMKEIIKDAKKKKKESCSLLMDQKIDLCLHNLRQYTDSVSPPSNAHAILYKARKNSPNLDAASQRTENSQSDPE